jgi:transcriptional regulator with XRE-family HTH domain
LSKLAIGDIDMSYLSPILRFEQYRQVKDVELAMTERQPSEIFQERLKTAREQLRKWSQSELASRAGMPPSSIAHFETGSRKPSFDTLRRLANALEVTTDYLLGRVDDPGLAEAGDPLYRDVGKLTGNDRELAKDFLKMLAERNQEKKGGDK